MNQPQPQPQRQHDHLPLALRRRLGLLEDSADALTERVQELLPAWLRTTRPENRLPVMMAVLVAAALQFTLPRRLSLPPRELLPSLELLLVVVLTIANPVRLAAEHRLLNRPGFDAASLLAKDACHAEEVPD